MSDVINQIKAEINDIEAARDEAIAELRAKFQAKIDAHNQAIALLGGKVNGSKPRTKPSRVVKPKARRAANPAVTEAMTANRTIVFRAFSESQEILSATQIVELTELAKPAVATALRQLVESGAVRVEGKGRATRYALVTGAAGADETDAGEDAAE